MNQKEGVQFLFWLLLGLAGLSWPLVAAGEATSDRHQVTPSVAFQRISRLEFNGLFLSGDRRQFSFADPVKQGSYWLELGRKKDDLEVAGFDQENLTVSVTLGELERTIPLKKNVIVPLLTFEERKRREEQAVLLVAQDLAVGFLLQRERDENLAERRRARESLRRDRAEGRR